MKLKMILGMFICMLAGCKTIVVKWPVPALLPDQIQEKKKIGTVRKLNISDLRLCPIADGVLYTSDGKQITGTVFVKPYLTTGRNMVHYPEVQVVMKPWSEITRHNIDSFFIQKNISKIDSVKLATPLPDGLGDTTTFVNTGSYYYLSRRLLANKKNSIYDITQYGEGYASTTAVLIKTPKGNIIIKGDGIKRVKKKILDYMAKKYGGSFDGRFATFTDMLRYILDRE